MVPDDEAHQAALTQFLRTDLDLGFTFASMAETQARDDEHRAELTSKALEAAHAVRRFSSRVDDIATRNELLQRVDELERVAGGISTGTS